ncbi:redoxin domain-containing protein [Algoriphagus sp. PAP.12]|uniref:redoxin domain-containing protein n=1 Tax=Algoriphagus sp. PAP.12 TaxID=2996678 RepID=UPI00227CAD96|nr:redoxin domain-containing protein [Algoriphagus sp. PAP.12]
MKNLLALFLFIASISISQAQIFQSLERIDAVTGKSVQVESLIRDKALVLVFHSLKCPFANMYQDRIIDLKNNYSSKGVVFALVNPEVTKDQAAELRKFIDDSGVNTSYLIDEEQSLVKQLGITKIPETIILVPGENGLEIVYKGAIDNNPQAANSVSERSLERAINQILRGEKPSPAQIRATGCNVKSF